MDAIITADGARIHYKDLGRGPTVVISLGWPLNEDSWEGQALFLVEHGYRVVVHDRRGFGRSAQPWNGYDYATFADDLAALFQTLDLRDVALFGFSMGGSEVARYIGRHGTARVSKIGLISAVTPYMLDTRDNSFSAPVAAVESIRAGVRPGWWQFLKRAWRACLGANRDNAEVSQGALDWFWLMAMEASMKGSLDCVEAFSVMDFTADLKKFDRPTLIIHGDDDQIVPIGAAELASAEIMKNAVLKVYAGAPHGLTISRKDEVNADMIRFLEA